jgi:hypothetical protein
MKGIGASQGSMLLLYKGCKDGCKVARGPVQNWQDVRPPMPSLIARVIEPPIGHAPVETVRVLEGQSGIEPMHQRPKGHTCWKPASSFASPWAWSSRLRPPSQDLRASVGFAAVILESSS